MQGIREAIARLLVAREAGERIALIGDYDADGVSGSAILAAVFGACGLKAWPIIPHRMQEGYGFQPVHVERARELGATVVVTVDCGTTSHAAAEAALEAGIDVIVTDHHLPGEPLPEGVVQINPLQPTCTYPFDELSGAGLAFKLGIAVAAACGREIDPRILLRVACLGTIADLVPLRGENRAIAAIGLAELRRTRSAGLRALIEVAGVRPPLVASDVGYRLGPRLNAPGRLDSAEKALELLLCRDPKRARELAAELDRWNRERQERERLVSDQAREAFDARPTPPPILVAWSEEWHRGVVGVAAGRLARELNRPVVLLAAEKNLATGSGRSIAGIHLHDFLSAWGDRLRRFGGHAQAIGLTVEVEHLDELRGLWEEAAEAWSDRIAVRRYEYELDLEPWQVNDALVAELASFEPFGQANPQPLVRVRGPLHLLWPPRVFGKGHLSAEACSEGGVRIRLLGWGWQQRSASLEGEFEVLGSLERDRFRGTVLRLVDARPYRRSRSVDGSSPVAETGA